MADQASDFIRQSQAMAQQSWEQWMRYLQQASTQPATPFGGMGTGFPPVAPAFGMGAAPGAPLNDVLERSLTGIKGYLDWMQRAASSQADPLGTDWQAQMQQLFGNASQPFAQAFSGIDSTAAQGFVQQWQAWLEAAGQYPGVVAVEPFDYVPDGPGCAARAIGYLKGIMEGLSRNG